METQVLTIFDLDTFERKLQSLNKRAAKVGVSPISWKLLDTVTIKKSRESAFEGLKHYEVFDHYVVEVEYERIVLPGGWRLVGVIDHYEGLTRLVPGESAEDLRYFVERGPVCDHCHSHRDRKETFIVDRSLSEDVKQVGRNCLGDFLGIDAASALDYAGYVRDMGELLEDEWAGTPKSKGIHLEFFLAHTVAMVRTQGWRSRSAARDEGGTATADAVLNNILWQERKEKSRVTGEPLWIDPSESDGDLAKKVLKWLQSEEFVAASRKSDYLTNLAQIGENEFVTSKSAGFAASAVVAYQKEQEKEIKRAAERANKPESQHFGKVGERLTINRASLVFSSGFDTQWGYSFIHKFLDASGNVIVWRTGVELEQGKSYKITCNIKEHSEYKSEKQTVITRAKTLEVA